MESQHSTWLLDIYPFCNKYLVPYLPQTTSTHTSWPDLPIIDLDISYITAVSESFVYFPYYLMLGLVLVAFLDLYLFNGDSNKFLTSFFAFSEEEVNALDDLLVSTLALFLCFFYNVLVFHTFFLNWSSEVGFLTFFAGIVGLLLCIPVTMLFNFGFYCLISIRGGATTLSIAYEAILDGINVTSFILRLLIQLVRIVVIGIMYIMYNELC